MMKVSDDCMSSNKSAKLKLIERYGGIDFLDRLQISVPENKKRYTSKGQLERMKQLTYHHILEKSKGGQATVENGALLTAEHHAWFHQQPEPVRREINDAFQELKRQLDVKFVEPEDLGGNDIEINIAEISIDDKGRLHGYNRAKIKRETRRRVLEELNDNDERE